MMRRTELVFSVLVCSMLVVFTGTLSAQRISFRQDNTALPPFGGYVPGAGATINSAPGTGITFRQGSAGLCAASFWRLRAWVGCATGI